MVPGRLGLILCVAAMAVACESIDLASSVAVTEVSSGWYDNGLKDGANHLVPSITFRLRNTGTKPLTNVKMTVSFWRDGEAGDFDSAEIQAIGNDPLAPGAETAPILVRVYTGYTLQQPRVELFMHSIFRDASAKLFAKRAGQIVPVGEHKIARQLLPHVAQASGRVAP